MTNVRFAVISNVHTVVGCTFESKLYAYVGSTGSTVVLVVQVELVVVYHQTPIDTHGQEMER
jgi:hypothetical protein